MRTLHDNWIRQPIGEVLLRTIAPSCYRDALGPNAECVLDPLTFTCPDFVCKQYTKSKEQNMQYTLKHVIGHKEAIRHVFTRGSGVLRRFADSSLSRCFVRLRLRLRWFNCAPTL